MKRLTYFSRAMSATLALTAFSCAVSVTLLSTGCGGGGDSSARQSAESRSTGTMTMTIKWPERSNTRRIPLSTNSITVTLDGASGPQSRTVARPADGSPSTVSFGNLPLRGQYTLTASAFASTDGSGIALARASAPPVTLSVAETNKSVVLDLQSTVVRIGIIPDPVSLSISGPGRTLQLRATGYDAATGGNLVPIGVGTVTYTVANPGIASLSQDPTTGVTTITANAVGNTTITATDSETGLSTTANVSVGVQATKLWTVNLDGPIQTGATVGANGTVYVPGAEGRLFAFTPTGATVAPYPIDLSALNENPVSKPLFLPSGQLFAFDKGGGYIFNPSNPLDPATQTQFSPDAYVVEPVFPEGRVINGAAIAPSGAIYAGTRNGTLSKATPSGATYTVTQIPTGANEVVNAPSVSATGNVFVTGSTLTGLSAKLYAFKPDNTALFPAVNLDGAVAVGTALNSDGSRVYAATGLNAAGLVKVYGINTTNGSIVWERTLPNAVLVSGAPVVAGDGTVYIGTWGTRSDAPNPVGGQVFALDGATGQVKPGWPFLVPFAGATYSDIDSSIALAPDGDTVYAGSVNGILYALRSNGSRTLEAVVSTEAIISTPAVAPDGTVYVGARDGTFSAFR